MKSRPSLATRGPLPAWGAGSPILLRFARPTAHIVRTIATLEHGGRADLARISEKRFQDAVVYWANNRGWFAYHNPDSRKCQEGFLDLWLASWTHGMLWRECKDETRKLTFPQKRMIEYLAFQNQNVGVWRPRHWQRIKGELK